MCPRRRIALVTCSWLPQLTPDDHVLRSAIAEVGMRAVPSVWDDEAVDWSGFDGCLIRSAWDYHLKPRSFKAWTSRVSSLVPLWNPLSLIDWNLDKRYLLELEAAGVPTIPTCWLQRGARADLRELVDERGWGETAILKPTVGLGAVNLHRVGVRAPEGQERLDQLLAANDVMVQPFVQSIATRGETSLVYVDGEFSHAVRKRPRDGDFRVQPGWGGTSASLHPSESEFTVAGDALACLPATPSYARVDLVEGPGARPWLIELELVDPNLFFSERPQAAHRLATAVAASVA
jgi:glutathione synthase/RimK-type ligase-like ATP-grasp enzyme